MAGFQIPNVYYFTIGKFQMENFENGDSGVGEFQP